MRRDWVLSLTVCVVILVGTLADVKPFSLLVVWNETLKHRWDNSQRRAPVPHAELLTLTELTEHIDGVITDLIVANLRAAGVTVESSEEVVGELAERHGMTPDQVFQIAAGQTQGGLGRGPGAGHGGGGQGGGGGRGLGRMTLREYCAGAGIDPGTAIEKLR